MLLGALVAAITSCSYEQMAEKLIPKEESQFAKTYLIKLKDKDLPFVKRYISPSIEKQVSDQKLLQVADYFPGGDLLSAELIGSQVNTINTHWTGNFTFEFHFSNGWAVANAVMEKNGDTPSIAGFNVYRTPASQQELNRFSLSGKTVGQYFLLFFAVAVIVFTFVTAYLCIRTPIPKRKWLWLLITLVGFGKFAMNWTTGQYEVQTLTVNLFSAGMFRAGPVAPWVLTVSLPLGAILFWIKRKKLAMASVSNQANNSNSQLDTDVPPVRGST